MKDYRVEVRVKNNRLYNAIVGEYSSITNFCRLFKFSQPYISDLINMRTKSIYKDGGTELKDTIKRLSDSLGKSVCELFPEQYYLPKNKVILERNKEELVSLESCSEVLNLPAPEQAFDIIEQNELKAKVNGLLNKLSPREERIIRKLHLAEESYAKVATGFNVTTERIRQIEEKAISKLRHPSRSMDLRTYISDLDNEEIFKKEDAYLEEVGKRLTDILHTITQNNKSKIIIKREQFMVYYIRIYTPSKGRAIVINKFENAFRIGNNFRKTFYEGSVNYWGITKEKLDKLYKESKEYLMKGVI